jgi:hypothetical protein
VGYFPPLATRIRRAAGQRDTDAEGGTDRKYARDGDFTAHEFYEAFADGEAEAGAAVAASRGSVDLLERTEKEIERAGGDADTGICNQKFKPVVDASLLGGLDFEADFTLIGKFDRVADEIDEDLAQAGRVTAETGRGLGGDEGGEVDLVAKRGG